MSARCPTTGKQCFTLAKARERAAQLRRRAFLPSQRHVNAYRCPDWKQHADAGHYHVARSIPRRHR